MNTNMRNTIFVVDDTSANLAEVEKALGKHYDVLTLLSAEAMFKALNQTTPDLILLDIEMPEMDGFEAIKQLKSDESYAKIPVIFFTDITDSATQAQGIELGAVDFIEKPFSKPLLLNRIKNYMNCKELICEQTKQPSADPRSAKTFVRNMKRHIARLEEVLAKNGSYDRSDLLVYYINNHAIKDALTGIGELELSAVAEKLEQAGIDKDKTLISSETPGFLNALRNVIEKYNLI